jgi:RNA polymerase sigma-70 factor (ECF subfamily)
MQTAEPELKALMLAALEGDSRAYRALLGDLRLRLAGFFTRRLGAQPSEADDLVQETLIAIHTRRGTYDPSQALLPWVYAIARYKLIDHYRRRRRRFEASLETAESELVAADASAAAEARRDVDVALSHLSERASALIRTLKLEGASVEEAAGRFGMSPGAVKVASHRALKTLNERYAPENGEGDD